MNIRYKLKQGDTLSISAQYGSVGEDGTFTPLALPTVTSSIREKVTGRFTANAVIGVVDAPTGAYSITADTSSWEPKFYVQDVKYVSGGVVLHTETWELEIERAITA